MKPFPSPFVEGFGWDESGELVFPGRPEVRPPLQLGDCATHSSHITCDLKHRCLVRRPLYAQV